MSAGARLTALYLLAGLAAPALTAWGAGLAAVVATAWPAGPAAAAQARAGVTVRTGKKTYKRKLSEANGYVYGETIRVLVTNRLERDIFFQTGNVMPFSSVYLECPSRGAWNLCPGLHGTAELPARYTSKEWLGHAVRLAPGATHAFEHKIEFMAGHDPFKAARYRFRLDYCLELNEPGGWLKRSNVSGDAAPGAAPAAFAAVFSNEFRIK